MTSPVAADSGGRLRLGVVLAVTEESCTVLVDDQPAEISFVPAFPRPRTDRVAPGHLAAVAEVDGSDVIVWRWFDAVIVGTTADRIHLWEPFHGVVSATPRDPGRRYVVGTRAYLSSGLPGAAWWVAGPTAGRVQDAAVESPDVERFLVALGMWSAATTS